MIEVVDVHTDVAHAAPAGTWLAPHGACGESNIAVGVESLDPKLKPLIVSITPEQVGKFVELAPLITGASKEKSRIAVPTRAETTAEMVTPGFVEA
jgi:hypothetical protein